jgi:hypothetical protein
LQQIQAAILTTDYAKNQDSKTALQASMIVLGTDYFGSTVSRQDSMQLMDYYLEAGGNVLAGQFAGCALEAGQSGRSAIFVTHCSRKSNHRQISELWFKP